jgi:RecA-family ATPase
VGLRFLLFGSAAVIGAVDGAGKGTIAVTMILAMITGRPLLGERVWRSGPVAIVSYEDDEDEWHRRIAAACTLHDLNYEKVIDKIHFLRCPGGDAAGRSVQQCPRNGRRQ